MTTQRDINRRSAQFNQKGINEKATTIKNIQTSVPLFKQTQTSNICVRRAKLTADAGESATITANIYNDAGVEQTSGDESGVTVYFRVHPAANMNSALPLLSSGEEITVVKLPYLNGETLEQRWYCTSDFYKADICD